MQRNTKLLVGAFALTGFVLLAPAHAAVKSLTCGGIKTITAEAAKLSPGDVLQVSGACTENVSIPAHVNSITLQGVSGAAVEAPPGGTGAAFSVRGRAIRITGFTIRGAGEGVQVIDGGFAWIHGNTIESLTGIGINLATNGTARIWSNIIRNNGASGINISRNSSATIGVVSFVDVTPSPNEITGNAGEGIHVSASMSAIFGNVISNNGSHGVLLTRGSSAEVSSNTIAGNAGSGVAAIHNSTLRLGNPTGTDLRSTPNSGTGNGEWGVQCNGGGHVGGRLGGLGGSLGATDILGCAGGL